MWIRDQITGERTTSDHGSKEVTDSCASPGLKGRHIPNQVNSQYSDGGATLGDDLMMMMMMNGDNDGDNQL